MLYIVWLQFMVLDINLIILVRNMSIIRDRAPNILQPLNVCHHQNKSFQGVIFSNLLKVNQGCSVSLIKSDQYRWRITVLICSWPKSIIMGINQGIKNGLAFFLAFSHKEYSIKLLLIIENSKAKFLRYLTYQSY